MTSRIAMTTRVWFDVHIESPVEAYISISHWGLFRIWFDEVYST